MLWARFALSPGWREDRTAQVGLDHSRHTCAWLLLFGPPRLWSALSVFCHFCYRFVMFNSMLSQHGDGCSEDSVCCLTDVFISVTGSWYSTALCPTMRQLLWRLCMLSDWCHYFCYRFVIFNSTLSDHAPTAVKIMYVVWLMSLFLLQVRDIQQHSIPACTGCREDSVRCLTDVISVTGSWYSTALCPTMRRLPWRLCTLSDWRYFCYRFVIFNSTLSQHALAAVKILYVVCQLAPIQSDLINLFTADSVSRLQGSFRSGKTGKVMENQKRFSSH